MIKLDKIIFIKDPFAGEILGEDEDVFNLKEELSQAGIEYNEIITNDGKPDFKVRADLIVLDWGGMGTIGNSLFASFIRQMIEEAKDRPNQLFLIYSEMLDWALRDLHMQVDELPANILCSVDELRNILGEQSND